MKSVLLIATTVALLVCVLGAPMHRSPFKDFRTKLQPIHTEAAHSEHDTTMPAKAIHYPRVHLANPTADNTSAAGWFRKFGRIIAVRLPKKHTTAAAAKSNDKADCWTLNGNMPEECVDDNGGNGKGKVYPTQKEQKKGEDLEQAKEDSKMWEGHLHWDGKDKM